MRPLFALVVLAIAPAASADRFDSWRSSPAPHGEAPGGKKNDDEKKKDDDKNKEPAAAPPSSGGGLSLGGIGLPLGLGSFGVGLGAPSLPSGGGGGGGVGAGAAPIGGVVAGATSSGGTSASPAGGGVPAPHDALTLTPPLADLLTNTTSSELSSEADVKEALASADQLLASGSSSVACGLYERAFGAERTPGNLAKLAHCYEVAGKVSSAWLAFTAAGDAASAARLEKSLPKLTLEIVVDKGAAPPEVLYDDHRVERSQWGKPVPVDPGEHVVRVIGKGSAPFQTRVTIPKSATTTVVHWPDAPTPIADERPAVDRPWYGSGRVLFMSSLTVVAGLGTVGGALWTLSVRSDYHSKNGMPGSSREELDDLHRRARTLGIATTALAGVTVIGFGLTTIFIAKDTGEPKPEPKVSFGGWFEAGSAGFVLRGVL